VEVDIGSKIFLFVTEVEGEAISIGARSKNPLVLVPKLRTDFPTAPSNRSHLFDTTK
jgi:hypothetical protein